jgi:opacity protein-like surface antigen
MINWWHDHKQRFAWAGLAVAGLLLLASATAVQAAVTLKYFKAEESNSETTILTWETSFEAGTVGYRISRDDRPDEYITVTHEGQDISFIPAFDSVFGGIYTAVDNDVTVDTTYTYLLYEVTDNAEEDPVEVASATITIGDDDDNVNPIIVATATSAPTTPPTSTPTTEVSPTSTSAAQSATNTPTPTATATPTIAATATRQATATPTTAVQPTNIPRSEPTTQSNSATTNNNNNGTSGQTENNASNSETTANQEQENEGVSIAEASEAEQEYPIDELEGSGERTEGQDAATETDTAVQATAYPENTEPAPEDNTDNTDTTDTGYEASETGTVEENAESVLGASQIGSGTENSPAETAAPAQTETGSNNLILWGGFLAALAIFVAGIIGSILLFVRRR